MTRLRSTAMMLGGLSFVLAACQPSTAARTKEPVVPNTAGHGVTPIAYAAHGGSASTEATLHIEPSGDGRMFLGSTMSLPTAGDLDAVGTFAGKVDARRLKRVTELLRTLPDLAAPAPPVPGSVVRSLSFSGAGGPVELMIPGYAEAPLDEVERLLQEVMVALVSTPASTIRVQVDVADDGPGLVLSSAGASPARVRLVDGDGRVTARGTVVVLGADGSMYGTSSLDPATVTTAAPAGVLDLAPGDRLRFPVAPPDEVPKGRVLLSGGLELDLEHDGTFRRISAQALQVPFGR